MHCVGARKHAIHRFSIAIIMPLSCCYSNEYISLHRYLTSFWGACFLNIAIIGGGIAGLSAAHILGRKFDVTLFEAEKQLGGHANSVVVQEGADGEPFGVDTGFIVFNQHTYPHFSALLGYLGVQTVPTEMSFAFSEDGGRFEYSGSGLTGLFGQPSNLLRPRFWTFVKDIRRFMRTAREDVRGPLSDVSTMVDYLQARRYGDDFARRHLLPMMSAIWSTDVEDVLQMPAQTVLGFFDNHGLLRLRDRPKWRTVAGGSRTYVDALSASTSVRFQVGVPVEAIRRDKDSVLVATAQGAARFDHVIFACHADQALALLKNADDEERHCLADCRFQKNEVVLHRDARLMPKRRKIWSSWNFLSGSDVQDAKASVTYWMNRLHRLEAASDYFVTLNPLVRPAKHLIISEHQYDHPVLDVAALKAKRRLAELQGRGGVWYCGAWLGYGFHEDGVRSAVEVAARFGVEPPWVRSA
jgi:predicted NAD/FAD-binding protein